jgi:ubiquinol-cytochrome c reductase cytochrome c subunit
MSGRGVLVVVTAAIALAIAAPAAQAQPPVGIVRPGDESGLSVQELGAQLYAGNCASCHGVDGRGVVPPPRRPGSGAIEGAGPPLRGVGARAADFYLRTGYMPLGRPGEQPSRSRPSFDGHEIDALVSYIAGLAPGPPIPKVTPGSGDIAQGQRVFTEHCAGCHQIVGQGGVVTGARVPPLQDATAVQIKEAVRTGPYLMPRFSARQIGPRELDSLVAYVLSTRHPPNRGGWGLGNIGPFPEGMVTWLIAAVVLVATCRIIGKRARR